MGLATPVIVATETQAGATILTSQTQTVGGIQERGVGTFASGKATIVAPTCTVNAFVMVTSLATEAEKANGIIASVVREAGQFKVANSTGAGTQKFTWAILA